MTYIKINEVLYPATISGRTADAEWDKRESKSITLEGSYSDVDALFHDGTVWSILDDVSTPVRDENGAFVKDENGNIVVETVQQEFDNSEYCIRGDLTVHTDGTCTVKMGKLTELEEAYEIMLGGM